MRRVVRRWLVMAVAAIALLVVLPTAMVWSRGGFIELGYSDGIAFVSWRGPLRPTGAAQAMSRFLTDRTVLGVRFLKVRNVITQPRQQPPAVTDVRRYLYVPAWYLVVAIVLVTAAFSYDIRRHRVPHGHCRACGYDLRASAGRCPECGAAAASSASATTASQQT